MENPESVEVQISIKPGKTKKTVELECPKCKKIIKSQKTYDNHVKMQVCYKPDEITYCKVCDLVAANHSEYNRHIISQEHLNAIGCDKLELLHKNEPSKILVADPYLTDHEARNIGTTNLGNHYTLRFADNQTQTITLLHNTKAKPDGNSSAIPAVHNTPTKKLTPISGQISNVGNGIETVNGTGSVQSNDYHIKMVKYIDSHAKTIDEKRVALIKILNSNVAVENFKGFQTFLKTTIQDPSLIMGYINTINEFINVLIKERTNGHKEYKGKDISKFVLYLSS
jgi:uncharacterized C2H2 Zn-finger protein